VSAPAAGARDEGSGYWIGVNSLRWALKAHDQEKPTQILEAVGKLWGTADIDELVNVGDGTPGPDFAALAPTIYELAEAGDPVALAVIQRAAADLVEFVLLVRDKLRRKHGIAGEVPVAWTGGVVEKMTIVRKAFFAGLHAAAPLMPVASEPVISLDGALWRAKRLAETAK
jgi:glucosamine kinase